MCRPPLHRSSSWSRRVLRIVAKREWVSLGVLEIDGPLGLMRHRNATSLQLGYHSQAIGRRDPKRKHQETVPGRGIFFLLERHKPTPGNREPDAAQLAGFLEMAFQLCQSKNLPIKGARFRQISHSNREVMKAQDPHRQLSLLASTGSARSLRR